MKVASRRAGPDRVLGQPQLMQLGDRNDPLLPRCKGREPPICRVIVHLVA
jgi:hypothetical protein